MRITSILSHNHHVLVRTVQYIDFLLKYYDLLCSLGEH